MDVFCTRLPELISQKDLLRLFEGPLKDCNAHVFHIEKFPNKGMAVITILDPRAAQVFLNRYGVPRGSPPNQMALMRISYARKFIRLERSNRDPTELSLQSLKYEDNQRAAALLVNAASQQSKTNHDPTKFKTTTLQCGTFDYPKEARLRSDPKLLFLAHFTDTRQGTVHFGKREAIVIVGQEGGDQLRIDLPYRDCIDIVLDTYEEPSVTFSLRLPPRMYEINKLATALLALSLGPNAAKAQQPKKLRISAINTAHAKIVGSCFVYRLHVSDPKQLVVIKGILSRSAATVCSVQAVKTSTEYPRETLQSNFVRLNHELSDTNRLGAKPFKLRYQVDRLARNGFLPPLKVLALLPKISELYNIYGLDATVNAICRFARDIPYPGPTIDPVEFSNSTLQEYLEDLAASYDEYAPDNPFELAKRHVHINLIHKIIVTPAGIRLEGPEPEPTNRVLRKYSDKTDFFVRVVFQDEDGGPVRYDPRTDLQRVYHNRFKNVLDTNILVCGHAFSFLGFSHSSLRSQSCWFMASFVNSGGSLMIAEMVLKELGNFSDIRTPAKCAARIGQNFTDTNATVDLLPNQVYELQVVERNGRDFSDGVGTISQDLLREVWRRYGTKKMLKPTVLQIRFQGAKGMVSLDPRLPGKALMLRSNMRKYETDTSWVLEICGAGFKPLPMVLNQQFIKIFEDLGIPMSVFLDLQSEAMKHLRQMTGSTINTARLLETSENTKATRMPDLIKYLGQIGLDYHHDSFIYSVVEMAVVSKLRDIKYRARIPVENGVTLYGIMDETGYLKENQIFVITEKAPEGGKSVLVKRNVVVTRSPAMHPGDIQVVDAVDVPHNSALRKLSNVVVFSKWGERDLPSKLSGGDLDGDLYNVIWHEGMVPRTTYHAADYPRVDPLVLDRAVTIKDMSDFFVTFMETDRLGMLCIMHMQLADQREAGTLDPDCIKLAGLASTAVDYSKTGIAVSQNQIPRSNKLRPDFMAPTPRVVVSEEGLLDLEEEEQADDDAFEGLDSEQRPQRYYASKKTLGHLYRNIDENQFLRTMQQEHRAITARVKRPDMMRQLLAYVKKVAEQYGILWSHQKHFASEIRRSYEDQLVNILYLFEPTPHHPLSESEAFAGQILGRQSGPQGKPLRDLAKTMRERFETIVEYTVVSIIKGHAVREVDDIDDLNLNDRELEALPRAIACLENAINEDGYHDRQLGKIKSFKYIAAAVCLRELDRYRVTTFGSYSGLTKGF